MNKVAIIDHVGDKSGMDIYDLSIASELSHKTKVFLFSNYDNSFKKNKNIIITKTFNKKFEKGTSIGKAKYFFLGFLKSYYFAKQNSIKTVIFHSFSYEYKDLVIYTMAKLVGLKIFLIAHDISGFANDDKKLIKKLILNVLANKILVHNEFSKRELVKEVNNNKIITIRLGGSVDYVKLINNKQEALSRLLLSYNFKYVLFFGQIKEVKGLDLLIKAFSRISDPNTKLIIAGKAWKDDFEKYNNLIVKLNLSGKIILLQRFIPDSEKDLLFSISDLVVIPYKKIYQSAVLLTALSYPTLVLCSDLEPNMEIIKDGVNGFLFKSLDEDSLHRKMESILDLDPVEINKIKSSALKTVKMEYSWKYTATKIEENL